MTKTETFLDLQRAPWSGIFKTYDNGGRIQIFHGTPEEENLALDVTHQTERGILVVRKNPRESDRKMASLDRHLIRGDTVEMGHLATGLMHTLLLSPSLEGSALYGTNGPKEEIAEPFGYISTSSQYGLEIVLPNPNQAVSLGQITINQMAS